jgi:hypothetical protein
MIYLKSALAGLLTIILTSVVLPILAILGAILYTVIYRPEGAVGWDAISLARQSPLPIVVFTLCVFAFGFLWEFRRLTHR